MKHLVMALLLFSFAINVSQANGRGARLLTGLKKQLAPLAQKVRGISAPTISRERWQKFVTGTAIAGVMFTALPAVTQEAGGRGVEEGVFGQNGMDNYDDSRFWGTRLATVPDRYLHKIEDGNRRGIYWQRHGWTDPDGYEDAEVFGISSTALDHYLYRKKFLTAHDYDGVFVSYQHEGGWFSVGLARQLHPSIPTRVVLDAYPRHTGGSVVAEVSQISGVGFTDHLGYKPKYRYVKFDATHQQSIYSEVAHLSDPYTPPAHNYYGWVVMIFSDDRRLIDVTKIEDADGGYYTLEDEEKFLAIVSGRHVHPYGEYIFRDYQWTELVLGGEELPPTVGMIDGYALDGRDLASFQFSKGSLEPEDYDRVLITYRADNGRLAMGLAHALEESSSDINWELSVSSIVPDQRIDVIYHWLVSGVSVNRHPGYAENARRVIIPAAATRFGEQESAVRYYGYVVQIFSDGNRYVRLDVAEDALGETRQLVGEFTLVHHNDLIPYLGAGLASNPE